MGAPRLVSHTGVVSAVNSEEITVLIQASSACASCQGKAFCAMSEKKDKAIHVRAHNGSFEVGEKVRVNMRLSLGMRAVAWAYGAPLCILIIILLTLLGLGVSEIGSALGTILVISLYYTVLYFFRDRLKQKYVFDIEKI